MSRIDLDLDDLTNAALKRLVKQLLVADDDEERKIVNSLGKKKPKEGKNDLADLHEEMHGKPNTPKVTKDDLPYDDEDELPDVPKQKGKKNG
jgi:hypothetical protein